MSRINFKNLVAGTFAFILMLMAATSSAWAIVCFDQNGQAIPTYHSVQQTQWATNNPVAFCESRGLHGRPPARATSRVTVTEPPARVHVHRETVERRSTVRRSVTSTTHREVRERRTTERRVHVRPAQRRAVVRERVRYIGVPVVVEVERSTERRSQLHSDWRRACDCAWGHGR